MRSATRPIISRIRSRMLGLEQDENEQGENEKAKTEKGTPTEADAPRANPQRFPGQSVLKPLKGASRQ